MYRCELPIPCLLRIWSSSPKLLLSQWIRWLLSEKWKHEEFTTKIARDKMANSRNMDRLPLLIPSFKLCAHYRLLTERAYSFILARILRQSHRWSATGDTRCMLAKGRNGWPQHAPVAQVHQPQSRCTYKFLSWDRNRDITRVRDFTRIPMGAIKVCKERNSYLKWVVTFQQWHTSSKQITRVSPCWTCWTMVFITLSGEDGLEHCPYSSAVED